MGIFNVRYGNFNELKIKLVWSKVTVLYTSFVSFSWSFLYLLILLQFVQRCNDEHVFPTPPPMKQNGISLVIFKQIKFCNQVVKHNYYKR